MFSMRTGGPDCFLCCSACSSIYIYKYVYRIYVCMLCDEVYCKRTCSINCNILQRKQLFGRINCNRFELKIQD